MTRRPHLDVGSALCRIHRLPCSHLAQPLPSALVPILHSHTAQPEILALILFLPRLLLMLWHNPAQIPANPFGLEAKPQSDALRDFVPG